MRVLRSQYTQLEESFTWKETTTTTTTLTKNNQALSNVIETTSTTSVCTTKEQQNEFVHQTSSTPLSSANLEAIRKSSSNTCNSVEIPMDAISISTKSLKIQRPMQMQRRKTITDAPTPPKPKNINIKLLNTECQNGAIKLVIHFYKESQQWYTELCRSYEGKVWERVPRLKPRRNYKWLYHCHLCNSCLCCFGTMKSHLNLHLGIRPYRCADCDKKYPSRNSLRKHHVRTAHLMQS